jgi:hypothetical protein
MAVNATSTAVVVGGRRRGTRRCAGSHAEEDEDVSSPVKTKRYDGLDRFWLQARLQLGRLGPLRSGESFLYIFSSVSYFLFLYFMCYVS